MPIVLVASHRGSAVVQQALQFWGPSLAFSAFSSQNNLRAEQLLPAEIGNPGLDTPVGCLGRSQFYLFPASGGMKVPPSSGVFELWPRGHIRPPPKILSGSQQLKIHLIAILIHCISFLTLSTAFGFLCSGPVALLF